VTTVPGATWRAILSRESLARFASAFVAEPMLVASIIDAPVRGAANIRSFFTATAAMFESFAFTAETSLPRMTMLQWRGSVLGRTIEGLTLLVHDDAELIERVELYHRPLASLVAFADELARKLRAS
jgi:hypothetical protein